MKYKYLLYTLFFVLFLFVFPSSILASSSTNFTNDGLWEFSPNDGNSEIGQSYAKLATNEIESNRFPYLRSILRYFPANGPLDFSIDFKYYSVGQFGTGIAISPDTPQKNGFDISQNISRYVLFNIWQNLPGGVKIYAWVCPNEVSNCHIPYEIKIGSDDIPDINPHKIKFSYSSDGVYRIFEEDSNIPLFVSQPNQKRPYGLWFGNSLFAQSNDDWSSFEVSNIELNQKNSVVVIPGLGASWDYASLLNNSLSNNWQIPSFVTVYDSLIKSLENAGLELNKDLFVFSYDWRKPVDKLSEELSAFIVAHFGQNQKVNIVGHSLGGLIARIYEQNYGTDKVDKVITVGSPHLGALDAYSVWENASVWGNVWWEKAALELAVQLNQGQGKNRVDTLRSQAPVIKDLLPVYDYLNINGNLKHWNQLNQKNTYLSDKNNALQPSNITALYGDNEQTKSVLKAKNRSGLDTLIGVWEDGKPIDENPFITTFGDGTVISQSATGGYPSNNFSSNHVGLVSDINVIENILDSFGLDKTKAEIVPSDQKTNLFTAILRSPGRLEICNVQLSKCNGDLGVYIPEYKLFMLPGYNNEDLVVKVYEDGYGEYKLNLGNINTLSTWTVITGKLDRQGQIDNYDIHSASNSLSVYPNGITSENLLKQCKTKMNLLSPNWDKTNLVESILNNNLSSTIRIKYTRLLKMVLRNEIWKAKITKKSDNIYQALDCWENADYEVKNFLSNSSVRINPINYQLMVSRLGNTINSKLATSKNLTAYEAYQAAQNKLNDSKLTTNNSLSMELASSAEQLFLVSLDLR